MKLSPVTLSLLLSLPLLSQSACGGGGGGGDVFIGFSEGSFAGNTDYQLKTVSGAGGSQLCSQGLDGLYRENPLGYTIAKAGAGAAEGTLSVTKFGKGSPVGEVGPNDQTLHYEENFGANTVPGTAIRCAASNKVTLSPITTNLIDAEQELTFNCTSGGLDTLCVFIQNASLTRQ